MALRNRGLPPPLCGREPDRLGHAEAAAVFAEALHIQHLIEGKVQALALHGAFPFCPPGAENVQGPLGHSLGIQDLEVVEEAVPAMSRMAAGGDGKASSPSTVMSLSSTAARRTPSSVVSCCSMPPSASAVSTSVFCWV